MNDNELKAWMKPYQDKITKFVIPCDNVAAEQSNDNKTTLPEENNTDKIHPENQLLAYACYLHQDATITELYEIANMPLSTGNKRKMEAMKDGLVGEFSTVIKAGRGGTAKFLFLTKKGHETLHLIERIKARGGAEHNHWLLIIQQFYNKLGYEVEIEKHIQKFNGFIDILAEKDNEKIVIEVCIQKQNIQEIIEKLNSDSFSRRILCFQTERQAQFQKEFLSRELPEMAIEGFEFKPLYEFYRR